MDATEFARTTGPAIGHLGGAFMTDDATTAIGAEYGLDFASFYGLGRGSVLGNTQPSVAAAAYPFIAAELVEAIWTSATETLVPDLAVEPYARACQEWGRRHFAGLEGVDHMADLLKTVVDGADCYWGSLFAGWRAVALPDDVEGRAAQLLHVARELRGAIHVMALLTAGISPLEAVLVASGPEGAAEYFWPEPYPDPQQFRVQHDQAMATTDELFGRICEVLSPKDRSELAALLDSAMDHVG